MSNLLTGIDIFLTSYVKNERCKKWAKCWMMAIQVFLWLLVIVGTVAIGYIIFLLVGGRDPVEGYAILGRCYDNYEAA